MKPYDERTLRACIRMAEGMKCEFLRPVFHDGWNQAIVNVKVSMLHMLVKAKAPKKSRGKR